MKGDTDEQIRETLVMPDGRDVGVGKYNELKKELYRQEEASLQSKTTEDVYLEYKWAQEKCLEDLDNAIVAIPENQPNAVVGAIKAKSEILDKILKTGQDIGVIAKTPERKVIIHGHIVAQMSNKELRQTIAQETRMLASAVDKYGDVDMMGNPIDSKAPTFSPQGKTGMNLSGPVKAAAARASRQAVKRTKIIDVPPG